MHTHQPAAFECPEAAPAWSTSLGLIALMLGAGVLLRVLAGPPHLPSSLPTPADVRALLAGSTLAPEGVAAGLVGLAWLLWLWVIGSMLLEAVVVACETVSHGARWASQLRQLANRLSLPFARRAVAATLAVHLLTRAVPIAAAQPLTDPAPALVVSADAAPADSTATAAQRSDAEDAAATQTYLVQPGDTLWSIAQAAYGSGTEYRRILEANVGRRMPDSQRFTARGVIQPGWELQLPVATSEIEERDGQAWYTVQSGDTLSGIAARVLHDEARWSDLFKLNRGQATADGRYRLENPNLIWPGLRLRLPDASDPPPDASTDPAPADVPAEPADPAPAPAPSPMLPDPTPTLQTAVVTVPTPIVPAAQPTPSPDPAPPVSAAADESIDAADELDQAQQVVPAPVASPTNGLSLPIPLASPASLSAVGLASLAGAALGVRRLRRLRPLPQEPESEVLVEGGYAEAQLTQDFARNLQGGGFDPVAALAAHLLAFLHESDLSGVSLVAVRHGRSSTTLSLAAGLAEQARLLELAPIFAGRIEAEVEACLSADQDVILRLTRLRKTRLLPPADAQHLQVPLLVPLGVLYDRQTLVAAWPALGHVLVASLPGQGSETILTSLIATLTARRSPQELGLWCVHAPRALPAALGALPHVQARIDPTDPEALDALVDRLRAELDSRTRAPTTTDLIVLIPELIQLGEHATALALLARRAGALGVRFIVGTADPSGSAAHPLLPHLDTRMVLHMQDEDTSVGLLGAADAAYLGGGGRLLLRLDGRQPVELYGYQVSAEHLARLVRVMRASYQLEPAPRTPPVPAAPAEPPVPDAPAPPSGRPAEPDDRPPQPATLVRPQPEPVPPSTSTRATQASKATKSAKSAKSDGATESCPDRPPLRVICLGGPRVLFGARQVWPAHGVADGKAFELLIYLACQPPEGAAREDVAEALWPEADFREDEAHRIRNLRYRLRKVLQSVPGGPQEDGIVPERLLLRLDPSRVQSDAHEFLTLVRAARVQPGPAAVPLLEHARALYAGDLLAGPEARRYAWVDERDTSGVTLREHFRRQFQVATRALADAQLQLDNLPAAVQLYRELVEMDPTDDDCWQALFRLHAQRGDRAALVREEQRMHELLQTLSGDDGPSLDPSDETRLVYQRALDALEAARRVAVEA